MAGDPGFATILEELLAIHEKKNADYGMRCDPYANINAAQDFGINPWLAAMMRASEKVARLKAFVRNGRLENESVQDSLLDLASYAIIALRLYRAQEAAAPRSGDSAVEYLGGERLSSR